MGSVLRLFVVLVPPLDDGRGNQFARACAHDVACDVRWRLRLRDLLVVVAASFDMHRGLYYHDKWSRALAIRPTVVSVTSFNEWHEGSQIEEVCERRVGRAHGRIACIQRPHANDKAPTMAQHTNDDDNDDDFNSRHSDNHNEYPQACPCPCTPTHTRTHTRTHASTHTHTHTQTKTQTRTRTHST